MPGPGRISVTSRGDFDNSSDPAAGSSSSGSNVGNDDDPARGNSDPITPGTDANENGDSAGNEQGGGENANDGAPDEAARIEELRVILGMQDAPIEELRAILQENDRASENSRRSANDERMAQMTAEANSSDQASRASRGSVSGRRASRRSWQPCQPTISRPGIFRVGGPIETGGTYNIGTTDEMDLEIKRIEAVSQVQEALNEKLGYNLRESGEYEEMERLYQEGERMLASTGLARREKKVLPAMMTMMWEDPPGVEDEHEPEGASAARAGGAAAPPLVDQRARRGGTGGGNGEICLGKFVDTGPNRDDDEEKREDFSVDHDS